VLTIRPMTPADVGQAEEVAAAAFSGLRQAQHLPSEERTDESIARSRARMTHLVGTDPGGSWVAVDGDQVLGVALALTRGGVWVLSLLVVSPSYQDRGTGRRLLERALAYGDPAGPGIILASPDPRALHRYVSAGFSLHPSVTAWGTPRRRPRPAPGIVTVGPDGLAAALDEIDTIDTKVRGASRRPDMEANLSVPGARMLLDPGRGYALVRRGLVLTVAALDEEAAGRLVATALAEAPEGEPAELGWITGTQQWAVRAAAEAGLELRVRGAVMVRGWARPPDAYLPSGAFG